MKLIKEIKSTIQRLNAYGEEMESYYLSEATYNEKGHRTSFILFGENGQVESKSIFEVDEKGNIINQMHYEQKNDLVERTDYFDNDDNTQYQTEITAADGSKAIHEYKYNQLGNTDQIIIKNEDDSIEAYEFFKYNEKGILQEEVRTHADYSIQFKKKISYTGEHISKEEFFDYANRLQREITYQVDEKGLVLSKLDSNLEWGTLTENRYTYDLAGNQIVDETYQNGRLDFKNQCHYDEHNNLVEEKIMRIGQENSIEIIHHIITYW